MNKTIHSEQQKKLQALLQKLRKEAGLKQSEVAALLSKPQSFVSKYEAGERRLDFVELIYICNAVNITLTEFVKKFEES
ncbi:MAG: helix-turn-helix transcriptional regulator [Candidatus Margulisiibacteriota bacterium]|jgi:transcriptional regulator with XRE-family HTH domain